MEQGEITGLVTSDEILQSLFDDIKGPIDVSELLMSNESSKKSKKEKKKDREKDGSEVKSKRKKHKKSENGEKTRKKSKHKDKHKDGEKSSKSKRTDRESESKKKEKKEKKEHKSKGSSSPKSVKPPVRKRRRSDTYSPDISPVRHFGEHARDRVSTRKSRSPIGVYRHYNRRSRSPRTTSSHEKGFKWGSPTRARDRPWDHSQRWSRSPSPSRRKRSDSRSPGRYKSGRRSRSREPGQIDESKLDKKELLDIAYKTTKRLQAEGKLPSGFNVHNATQNKNVQQLVKLCEDISAKKFATPAVLNESLVEEKDVDFDFTTNPVRSSTIRLNVGNALKPKSALERLIENNALKSSFPVSSGSSHVTGPFSAWEPVQQPDGVVSQLRSKKVKIAPAYLTADELPPPPPPPKPKKAEEKVQAPEIPFLTPPPVAPVLDWASLLEAPTPPVFTVGFDEPAPPPPARLTVVNSFNELLTERKHREATTAVTNSADDMGLSEGQLGTGLSSEAETEGNASEDKNEDGDVVVQMEVRETVEALLDRVVELRDKTDEPQAKTSKWADDEVEEGQVQDDPVPSVSGDRVVEVGSSVFGSFMTVPLFSQKTLDLPLAAPVKCSHLVTKRAELARRLMENQDDFAARIEIADVEIQLSRWAESKNGYGARFGVAPLIDADLQPRPISNSLWATKDTLHNAPELKGGIGAHLLQKMGWEPGYGLGRRMDGPLEPLALDVKNDRKGLFTADDKKPAKKEKPAQLNGKNPVSMIMEYCSKHGIPPPLFIPTEDGQPHNKMFGCKVRKRAHKVNIIQAVLNNVEYNAATSSSNKKAAKAQVCMIMCRALDLI